MTVQAFKQRPPGPAEYGKGHHYRWEVDAHVAEDAHAKKHNRPWTLDERRRWLGKYFYVTPYLVQYQVIECPVCAPEVEKAIFEGRNPYACPPGIAAEYKKLTAKFGTSLGLRKRHIDSV